MMVDSEAMITLKTSAEMQDGNDLGASDRMVAGSEESSDKLVASSEKIGLKRQIGILGSLSFLIGGIIGAGIFASPTSVAKNVVSVGASLMVWVACGVLSVIASLSFCELGTMYPNASGSIYFYLFQAFGPIPSFLFAFTTIFVIRPSSLALITLVCGKYILIAIQGYDVELHSKLIAAGVIVIILFVNCIGVRYATATQIFFTAAKMIAVVMIIITGFVRLGQGYDDNFENAFNGTATSVSGFAYALYGGLWAYSGWDGLNYITEEMSNPVRDLPIAVIGGLPVVTACYCAMNAAYLTVMTNAELAKSGAVAVYFSNKVYGVMAWIIPFFVACSTFGTANGKAFITGRLIYVAANQGHLPSILGMIHRKRHTPLPAILFIGIIALIMLFPKSTNFQSLVNKVSFSVWTFNGATFAALIWLRIRKPELKRPYKVFIGLPIISLVCSVGLVVAPFIDDPLECFYGLLVILSGLIIYVVCIYYNIIPQCIRRGYDALLKRLDVYMAFPTSEEELETLS